MTAKGERAKINEAIGAALAGTSELASLDARLVQPYYTRVLAESAGLMIDMAMATEDTVAITAKPKVSAAAA